MKMEGNRPKGTRSCGGKTLTVRRDLKGRTETLTEKYGKVSARPATPHRETAAKWRKLIGSKSKVGLRGCCESPSVPIIIFTDSRSDDYEKIECAETSLCFMHAGLLGGRYLGRRCRVLTGDKG